MIHKTKKEEGKKHITMPLRWEFQLFWLDSRPISACFDRFGCRPIRPNMVDTPDSGRISPVRRTSKPSRRESERKKKQAHKRPRRVGNRVGLGCGTLPAASVLSSCLPISLRIMLVCHGPAIFCFNSAETLISHDSSLS